MPTPASTELDAGFPERVALAQPDHAHYACRHFREVQSQPLTFFPGCILRRAKVVDVTGEQELRYLDDGQGVVWLDGTPGAIHTAADRRQLQLKPDDVPAYVRFFFESTGDGQLRVVETEDDLAKLPSPRPPWLADPAAAYRQHVHAMQSTPQPDGGFQVTLIAVWQSLLVELTIGVTQGGHVEPISQRPLIS